MLSSSNSSRPSNFRVRIKFRKKTHISFVNNKVTIKVKTRINNYKISKVLIKIKVNIRIKVKIKMKTSKNKIG